MNSRKKKCLEMWQWLSEHPDKDKDDFRLYLKKLKRSDYHYCSACLEAQIRALDAINDITKACNYCPITWIPNNKQEGSCTLDGSPYNTWESLTGYDADEAGPKAKAARDIIHLIKTTWED